MTNAIQRDAAIAELVAAAKAAVVDGQTPLVEVHATHKVVGEYVSPDERGTRDVVATTVEVTVAVPNGGEGAHKPWHPRDVTVLKTATFYGEFDVRVVIRLVLGLDQSPVRREAKVCEFEIAAVPPGRGCRNGEPACTGEIWAVVDATRGAYFERRRPGGGVAGYPPARRWLAEDGRLVSTDTGKSVKLKIDREHALSVLRSLL